ncbi:MAG TPA: sugar ABC transporter ATP-binding protein [Anaeromyxobacter sp.]|nr:sugar ABC transporter ATP-binding protein [Anaeromyxobacter sp.]
MAEVLLRLQGISKSFAGNRVLDDVSVEFERGKCYAVVGENGAGKSTLMKIIGGIYRPDAGSIFFEGQQVQFHSAAEAIRRGISVIHQELSLAGNLSVAHNIFCNREFTRRFGFVDWPALHKEAGKVFEAMGVRIDTRTPVARISIAMQQIVEIGKALSLNSKILIMDEPTSALSEKEVDHLYEIVANLRARGVTVIFISHKLSEVFRVAERIIVLRDGLLVGNEAREGLTRDQVVRLMVGRQMSDMFPRREARPGRPLLEARELRRRGAFSGISFELREGEVLGFAGLVGSGRTEVARALFGADRLDGGELRLRNRKLHIRSPRDAIREGICYLTEDRKREGLFLPMTVRTNLVAASLEKFVGRHGFYRPARIQEASARLVSALDIRPADDLLAAGSLSGGNQQKTLLAKWLCTDPQVLIADEPTRGVDVGAKAKIYQDLRALAGRGVGVIVISSELPEILGLCDRVAVFSEGRMVRVLDNDHLVQEDVMRYAAK